MTMRNITTASLVLLLHPLLINAFTLPSHPILIYPHATATTVQQQSQLQPQQQEQQRQQKQYVNNRFCSSLLMSSSSSSADTATTNNQKSIAIISPPGGIGEITAVRAAEMGASVRWFVVTPPPPPSGSSTFSLDAFPKIPWFGGGGDGDNNGKGKEKENTAAATASVVRFSAYTLASIQAAGGSVELAGASADALLSDDSNNDESVKSSSTFSSAAEAAAAWCGSAVVTDGGIVCCYDGITEAVERATVSFGLRTVEEDEAVKMGRAMAGAVRVATAATCRRSDSFGDGGRRVVAILPAGTKATNDEMWEEEMEEEDVLLNDNDGGDDGGVVAEVGDAAEALLGSFWEGIGRKGMMVKIPPTLENALVGDGKSASSSSLSASVFVLRHGELFGEPDSSPDSSPFVGGPRLTPVLSDEFRTRGVRVDPTISLSGTSRMGAPFRTSRLSAGEAAARIVLQTNKPLPTLSTATKRNNNNNKRSSRRNGILDVCLTSLDGTDPFEPSEWYDEFNRVVKQLETGRAAELFRTSFGTVPDVGRLADWLAQRWAPAVLRTYDIAGIRVGPRPVYARRLEGDNEVEDGVTVEIVWQELRGMETFDIGTMKIVVTRDGMDAVRAPPPSGGIVSARPLAGEDVLVRLLAEAATQAIDKGLATKPKLKKKPKKKKAQVETVNTVSTLVPSEDSTVIATTSPPVTTATESVEDVAAVGPRGAGARRSTERTRGQKRTRTRTRTRRVPPPIDNRKEVGGNVEKEKGGDDETPEAWG